jgi:hypothetical protein
MKITTSQMAGTVLRNRPRQFFAVINLLVSIDPTPPTVHGGGWLAGRGQKMLNLMWYYIHEKINFLKYYNKNYSVVSQNTTKYIGKK